MGQTFTTNVAADTPLVTTAETVVATLPGVSMQRAGQVVKFEGQFTITLGTATTALTVRVREDSLTGAVVDEPQTVQIDTAAGSTEDHTFNVTHTPAGEVANKTYVLTVAQTAATANGTVTHASLRADTLP